MKEVKNQVMTSFEFHRKGNILLSSLYEPNQKQHDNYSIKLIGLSYICLSPSSSLTCINASPLKDDFSITVAHSAQRSLTGKPKTTPRLEKKIQSKR